MMTANPTTYEHWIGGKSTPGESDRSAEVFDPALGAPQRHVINLLGGLTLQPARSAFETWGESSVSARARVMFDFRQLLVEHEDELARVISSEHGKTIDDARGEVVRGREVVEFAAGIPQLLKGDFNDQVSGGIDSHTFRQALGVVAGITPFNFPNATRVSRTWWRGCISGLGCPTACSTSFTVTRWRWMQSLSTPTSTQCRSSAPPRLPSTFTRVLLVRASESKPSAGPKITRS